MTDVDFDVAVAGAGVAGLAVLQKLDAAGLRVMVLEARERVGGRILTVRDPLASLPLELGAEFVHGRPAEIWDVIRDASFAVLDATDASRYMNDGKVEHNADAWDWVGSILDDMQTAAQGPDQSFDELLSKTNYEEAAKRAARGYVEGFNAAEAGEISIHALTEEAKASAEIDGDRSFRFVNGYDTLPLHMLRSVRQFHRKLRLNTVVEGVEWRHGSVALKTRHTLTGLRETWRARAAVITAPLGVLQHRSIAFSPEPKELLQAASKLRFGQVYRVVLQFREAFWEERKELQDAGFVLSREDLFPVWWTTLARRSTILTGWSAGAHARGLQGFSPTEVLERALQSLARIIGFPVERVRSRLETMYFHDWARDAYALGAYSWVPVGAVGDRNRLTVPVADTLFFAGEATDNSGHTGTVHGAIASGRRAAAQVLSSTVASNR